MTNTNQHQFRALLSIALLSVVFYSKAQNQDWKTDKKINVVSGLTQSLLLKGFNIEVNYIHNRFIFDYSHGVSLNFAGSSVTSELKRQGLAVHFPWTTGFGVGYRVKEWINVRLEPKWHKYEFYYDGETQNKSNEVGTYNIMSLGVGLYGHLQPFKKSDSFLSGIIVAPSLRLWPAISSNLEGDSFSYTNKITKNKEEIKPLELDPGVGFTPLIFNVSVGYTFNLKKKK
jgi:hypothetical protein